jgi:hypothetical protein
MNIRDQLLLEHQNVETLLDEMKLAVAHDDPRALCEAWSRFERDLGDHLRFEERELLLPFSKVDSAEAAALRAEHDHIRRLVADLGISADLHTMRAAAADELLQALRAHGKREDGKLYRWAMEHLPPESLAQLDGERLREEAARMVGELRLKLHLLGLEARDELAEIHAELDKLAHESADAARHRYRTLLARLRRLTAPLD